MIYHLANLDVLGERRFQVIWKIVLNNLYKPIYDIIIITFIALDSKSVKVGQESGKIHKFESLKNGKNFLDEPKSLYHNFWNAVCCNEKI